MKDSPPHEPRSIQSVVVGFATSDGLVNTGFAAVSVPVFDHEGSLAAAMTALGPAAHLDTRPDGPAVAALRQAGAAASAAMGHRSPTLPGSAPTPEPG